MKFPKVGKRIIKTVIAVFISISVYIVLLAIDELAGFKKIYSNGLTIFYTPFFAAIAAVYALHRDKKVVMNKQRLEVLVVSWVDTMEWWLC